VQTLLQLVDKIFSKLHFSTSKHGVVLGLTFILISLLIFVKMPVRNIIMPILPKNHVFLVTMLAKIVLPLIYRMYVRSVRLDSKGISSTTLVSVPQATSMMDSNQVAKLVLMSTPTVFRALMPLIHSNRLLTTKTSSIRRLGPLTSFQTLLRSLV